MVTKSLIAAGAIAITASVMSASAFAGPLIDPGKAKSLNEAMNGNTGGMTIDAEKGKALKDALKKDMYLDPKLKDLFGPKKRYAKVHVGRGISCGTGSQIVRNYGFHRVRPIDCHGRTLTYLGRQHGEVYAVVLSRSGRIIDVDAVSY